MTMGIRDTLGAPKVGDWLPIVKFDALAGRFWKVDKDAAGLPALGDLIGKSIAVDFASAEIGWMRFGPQGPIRHMAPVGCPPVPMPDEVDDKNKPTFRPGFYLRVCGQAVDGVREWCSTTGVLVDTFDLLWAQYEAAPQALTGQIPLIVVSGATPTVKGAGARRTTTYMPIVSITGWVDRPDSLGPRTVVLSPPQPAATNGAANHPPQQTAPAATPAPQPAPTIPQHVPAAAATALGADVMPFAPCWQ
jgi:hypothetical protein